MDIEGAAALGKESKEDVGCLESPKLIGLSSGLPLVILERST